MMKRQLRCGNYPDRSGFWILGMVCLLWAGFSFAVSASCLAQDRQGEPAQSVQYKIFTLKHISAERGKKYLAQVGIGTVSQLPGASAILVTAQNGELTKAMAILKLVDAEEEFAIKAVLPASEVESLPSYEQIAAKVGDISVGSFSNPPKDAAKTKAIIDVHNKFVIAVAPVSLLEKIVSAVGQPAKEKIEKTERKVEKPSFLPSQESKGAEPNEPIATATVSEQKTRVTKPAAVSPYEPEPTPNGDEPLKLNLPEKVDIVSLLDLVGMYLRLNYMYDPALIKGGEVALKFHGKLQGDLRVKDLYPLLESVMKFKGFAMSRSLFPTPMKFLI